ncbi:MAG: carboxy terminal-processing peptidase [Cryomorphaceae bacterium]|jgi:carboxyl-terminal processing protease|nr:carboxy terminal-processing peptidase [Cryomorphaceae bacterium]MBT3504090.1 carboxy terminal-processing peptidase [Cryomorphaceae bacterium]MBT3688546.1 carboxy terminal-processing peptidase [Cryomorphaceae bacterium]MBT4293954.1 carboxy terminal-processing peptidase [Cryomorphaceae bacterium]MBT4833982.1 carboxy terminal-processing peptidase [Cryomorphaceae bacterium]
MFLRIFGFIISGIISLVIYFEVSNVNFSSDEPNKDRLLVDLVSYVLDKLHYDPQIINDDFSIKVYDDFIHAVDSQKRFLLKSDLELFSQYRLSIDDQINTSEITFFNVVHETLKTRIDEVESFYNEILEVPFNFQINEEINLDYENLEYAENTNELKKIWRKRLKLSALDGYASKKEINDEEKEDVEKKILSDSEIEKESRTSIVNNLKDFFQFNSELERADWFSIYLNSIVTQFDPHTSYFAPEAKEIFDQNISGKFQGIGARLFKRNQQVEISEIIIGGPVWRDNLLNVGDIIIAVAQSIEEEPIEISLMKLTDATDLIKGEKGTNVFLTVKRVDGGIEQVEITRDVVELEETYAKSSIIKDDSNVYGLINLPRFYVDFADYGERNAASDIKNEILGLKSKGINGLILDLRNNGGGSLKTVVDITGFFIEKGPVVQVKSIGGRKEILRDNDPSVIWDGPLVILVNEFSASASEILAAALQDYNRAIILGSKQTYGKGTVQNVIDLNNVISGNTYGDLGSLKITTDKFYRVNGGSTQLEGVKSDLIFPNRYSYIDIGEKDLENPLSWDKIDPAKYDNSVKIFNYSQAITNSIDRISQNEYFSLIDQHAKLIKSKQDDKTISLDYKSYKEDREKFKSQTDKLKIIEEFITPYLFEWNENNLNSNSSYNDDMKEKRDRWIETLEKDIYVDEAMNLLKDLSSFNGNDILSQTNQERILID